MSVARYLLGEMALNLGDNPNFDPRKRRKIEQGSHPYAENPAWPEDLEPAQQAGGIENFTELVASDQYPRIVNKIAQLLNIPVSQVGRNRGSLMMTMMQALGSAMQWQSAHKRELERRAINLVLSLPQFKDAAQAYTDGELRIRANLVDSVSVADMEPEAPEPEEHAQAELQVAEIAQELDAEKAKRRFMNLLTQGAAINQNFLHERIEGFLNQLNPRLLSAYSLATALAEYNYWASSDQEQQMMYQAAKEMGAGAGGRAHFEIGDDGVPTVIAEALILPVLIQELVKGLMEYSAYSDEEDPDTMREVYRDTDTLSNETWDIMFGPSVWRKVERVVGPDNAKYLPWLHNHLAKLSPGEFNRIVPEIVRGTPDGERYVQDLIRQWAASEEPSENE